MIGLQSSHQGLVRGSDNETQEAGMGFVLPILDVVP